MSSDHTSLRDLLAGYDRDVDRILREVLDTTTGTDRVKSLHQLRRSMAVHDSVVASVLCPLLDELPEGTPIASRLRAGCQERGSLLHQFGQITKGVAARNVYWGNSDQIETIVEGLQRSFEAHENEETVEVTRVLGASSASTDPEILATLMALEAGRAPTRAHPGVTSHPQSGVRKTVHHYMDRLHNWNDTHHGWKR